VRIFMIVNIAATSLFVKNRDTVPGLTPRIQG
jgi:hypothetical protein